MCKNTAQNECILLYGLFMGYLKGKSALMIFDRHPEYRKKGSGRHFWATGYYVDTVGRNEEQILKYIAEQGEADRIYDK